MKTSYLALLVMIFAVGQSYSSPTENEYEECKLLAVKSLDSCLAENLTVKVNPC